MNSSTEIVPLESASRDSNISCFLFTNVNFEVFNCSHEFLEVDETTTISVDKFELFLQTNDTFGSSFENFLLKELHIDA